MGIPNRTYRLSRSLAKTWLIAPRQSDAPSGGEYYTRTYVSTTSEEVGNTPGQPNPKTQSRTLLGLVFEKKTWTLDGALGQILINLQQNEDVN